MNNNNNNNNNNERDGLYRTFIVMTFNFFSSVAVVTMNKGVFQAGFKYSTLLTGFHFVVTYIGLYICSKLGIFEVKKANIMVILPLVITFCGFVVFNNLSLQYNSVGFYQLMKVLTTPVIACIEYIYYDIHLHYKLIIALIPICIGVAIATINDFDVNFLGTFFAICGIISTSCYQIFVKSKQQDLGLNSFQLLYYQAPLSAVLVFFISAFTEPIYGLNGWLNFKYSKYTIILIMSSCLIAFCVNLSIFLVIGQTSPISYNVLGHFKLCIILLSGYIIFGEKANSFKLLGIFLAFSGVVAYSILKLRITSGWDVRKLKNTELSNIKSCK